MKLKPLSLCNNIEEFNSILNLLEKKFQVLDFLELDSFISDLDIENYYWLKAYRSNLTEGNTTTDESFTKIIFNDDKNNLISNTYDEQYEIVNLKKVYNRLSKEELSIKNIQNINRILGQEIFKNRFHEFRGKFRTKRVFIPFTKNEISYETEFTEYKNIKEELNLLIDTYKSIKKDNKPRIFALSFILHNELIGIHPFVDGNGRTTRVVMEIELEKNNIIPFIPYENEKREYQLAMSNFSLKGQTSLTEAYDEFGNYILENYEKNINMIRIKLNKMKNLEKK